jgi:glutaredoxin 3
MAVEECDDAQFPESRHAGDLAAVSTHRQTQAEVVIYGTTWCPYCRRAKALLDRSGIRYREIDVGADPSKRWEMMERAQGRRTVPQIFINGHPIGGCDDLHALEATGKLDGLVRQHGQSEIFSMMPDGDQSRSISSPTPPRKGAEVGHTEIGKLLTQLRARIKRGWLRRASG